MNPAVALSLVASPAASPLTLVLGTDPYVNIWILTEWTQAWDAPSQTPPPLIASLRHHIGWRPWP